MDRTRLKAAPRLQHKGSDEVDNIREERGRPKETW